MKAGEITSDYTVETIETMDGFNDLQNDWERLYKLKEGITIFFSYEIIKKYFEIILKNFKKVKIKTFIIKNKNGRIIAIFPFIFETTLFPSFLSLKELGLKHDYLIDFYFFLIDPAENQKQIIQQLFQYLNKRKKMWDIIKIKSIPEDEHLLKNFLSIIKENYKFIIGQIETLVIDCEGDYDNYIKNMKGRYRKTIRRQYRRLEFLGNVKVIEIKHSEDVEEGLKFFYDIEDSGWKGRQGTSLKKSFYGEYYKELANYFSKHNKFRLYFLKVGDKYIAGIYSLIDNGIIYNIKTGYSEEFYQYSPSNVLFYLLSEQLFKDETIKKIDYYGPYVKYEEVFGKKTRTRFNITICNKKILSISYFIILKMLQKLNYPFPKGSLRNRTTKKLMKFFYN